jgi:hypothetical protein
MFIPLCRRLPPEFLKGVCDSDCPELRRVYESNPLVILVILEEVIKPV